MQETALRPLRCLEMHKEGLFIPKGVWCKEVIKVTVKHDFFCTFKTQGWSILVCLRHLQFKYEATIITRSTEKSKFMDSNREQELECLS